MLAKLSAFFDALNTPTAANSYHNVSLEIACAVLLYEVMRADGEFTEQEQNQLNNILQEKFTLDKQALAEINQQAQQLSEHANDFYQFTSKINQHYDLASKKKIVGLLWQVAYADGHLASIEEHIIRKIADLLHLNHQEYIATKIAAQDENK